MKFLQHLVQHLRLDAEHQQIGLTRHLAVVGCPADAEPISQFLSAHFQNVRRDNLLRLHDMLVEQRADHRLAHDAAADKADGPSFEHLAARLPVIAWIAILFSAAVTHGAHKSPR
jgi:hypothetical protein